MLSTGISNRHEINIDTNRHQVGFHKILHRIRGDFSLAQPLLEQYHMNHVDEFHEFFEVGKKMHTK